MDEYLLLMPLNGYTYQPPLLTEVVFSVKKYRRLRDYAALKQNRLKAHTQANGIFLLQLCYIFLSVWMSEGNIRWQRNPIKKKDELWQNVGHYIFVF